MQKNFYCFLLLILGAFGCGSDESIPVNEPTIGKTSQLDYYVDSYDLPGPGFEPQLKITYEYNSSGSLSRYHVLTYSPTSKSFDEQRYFDFFYSDTLVTEIVGFVPGSTKPILRHVYEYFPDGRVSKIKETNTPSGINSHANFVYDDTNHSTKVSYTFSNGGSFQYEFYMTDGNMVTDKTTRGAQLCSDGQYSYDDHKNPFGELGYTDYLLTNVSANNKVSENINHVGCSFPSFIPVSYSYEYNDRGYPTLMTTFYKSGSGIGKSKREIFYR